MSTLDSGFVIAASSIVFISFLTFLGFVVYVWLTYRRIVRRAEFALDTVNAAAHMIREVGTKSSAATATKVIKYVLRRMKKG